MSRAESSPHPRRDSWFHRVPGMGSRCANMRQGIVITMPGPSKNLELLAKLEVYMVLGSANRRLSELAKDYSLTERTVQRYMRCIRERWMREEEEHRPQRRAEFRAMIRNNLEIAWATANSIGGAATLRLLAKLDGLEAPCKIEISGAVDVRAMSPLDRQAEIERLLKRRADALDGRRTTPLLPPAPAKPNGRGNGKSNGTKH